MDNTDEILSEIKRGNEEVFRQFFQKTYDRMKYLIASYVHDEEIVRDLIQDAYLKFWEVRHTIRPNSNLEAFLFTILRNRTLNFLKHQVVQKKYGEFAEEKAREYALGFYALNDPVTEKFFSTEIDEILTRVLGQLPEKTQQIFRMNRDKGLKYREIALQLNISEKVVEHHMMTALQTLREALKEYLR